MTGGKLRLRSLVSWEDFGGCSGVVGIALENVSPSLSP